MLVSKIKPCMSQHKRSSARLQMAHYNSNNFRSASSHMDNCGKSRANTCVIPDFWERLLS